MTEQKATPLEIRCLDGAAICDVIETPEGQQVNVYLAPNGGASMYAIFPADTDLQAMVDAIRPVLDGEPLEPDADITGLVAGSVLAGTVPRPTFKVQRQA